MLILRQISLFWAEVTRDVPAALVWFVLKCSFGSGKSYVEKHTKKLVRSNRSVYRIVALF